MDAAICTSCGGRIRLSIDRRSGECESCGVPFLHTDNTVNVTNQNTQHITQNISVKQKNPVDIFIRNADAHIKLRDFDKAKAQLDIAAGRMPGDCRVWFGYMKLYTSDFTDLSADAVELFQTYYKKAVSVATTKQREQIDALVMVYRGSLIVQGGTRRRRRTRRAVADRSSYRILRWSLFMLTWTLFLLSFTFAMVGIFTSFGWALVLCYILAPLFAFSLIVYAQVQIQTRRRRA